MKMLTERFNQALVYAAQLHNTQVRKGSRVPYISHLLGVAALVLEDGGDEDQAIAALLHDAIEDQGGRETLAEIRNRFGERVARIVDGCTDAYEIPKPPWRERKEAYLQRLQSESSDVYRVSLADKLHNARSLLMNLNKDGRGVWEKFNGGKAGTLWYYRALADTFRELTSGFLLDEFERSVEEIEKIAGIRIAVEISADIEWKAVLRLLPGAAVKSSPFGEWFIAHFKALVDEPVVFFHGGWGKIAAAASTQYIIERWQPDLLINLGTCGGFAGEINKGTLLLAERTLVYDILEQMGDFDEHIAHYVTEIDLSWLEEPFPQPVRKTLLVSADRDLVSSELPELNTRYGAIAGDWESGAIAWVASRRGVKVLILRGVSDLVGEGGSEAYVGNLRVFEENTLEIMRQLLEGLPGWIRKFQEYKSKAG